MRIGPVAGAAVAALLSSAAVGLAAGSGDGASSPPAAAGAVGRADSVAQQTDDEEPTTRHGPPAFVTAKKDWLACVKDAPRARAETACGPPPHPHDLAGRPGPGRPPWAGGPVGRGATPPGLRRYDSPGSGPRAVG